ncbi:hypothetical protein Tco_1231982, partial [Tanacetum coccineum]
REERSLNNNSFLDEYECSSLALDKGERRDEKKRLDHLKQDQTMMVVKEIKDGLLEEMEAHGFALWPSCEDFPTGHPSQPRPMWDLLRVSQLPPLRDSSSSMRLTALLCGPHVKTS